MAQKTCEAIKPRTGSKASRSSGKSRKSRKSKSSKKDKRGKKGKAKKPKTPDPSPPPPPVEPPPPKVRPKGTCDQDLTPGPGEYAATNLVGYYEHDPTKTREPAFTFSTSSRYPKKAQDSIPGPIYNCDETTRFGPVRQTGPILIGRAQQYHKGHLTPGPGHYSPEKYDNPRSHNAPEARLLGRHREDKSSMYTPGPGDYHVPSSVGDSHPTYNSAPSARILGRNWDKKNKKPYHYSPGPNEYEYDHNAFLKSGPSPRLLGREKPKSVRDTGPGPGAYFADYCSGREPPSSSFGIRHAKCVGVLKEEDQF